MHEMPHDSKHCAPALTNPKFITFKWVIVFVTSPEDEVPGGIPLRDEILRVVEVRPSGVLLLENQGGRSFTRHVEQCVPCNLSNVEGTVHPDLIKPSWKFPCSICGDHKQGAKMLLCDGCNLGFHTF